MEYKNIMFKYGNKYIFIFSSCYAFYYNIYSLYITDIFGKKKKDFHGAVGYNSIIGLQNHEFGIKCLICNFKFWIFFQYSFLNDF